MEGRQREAAGDAREAAGGADRWPGGGALTPARAARLFAALCLIVVAFQIALAAGAPWGSLAMGGAFPGRFPPAMRGAAVVQAIVLLFLVAIILARAGLALPRWAAASRRLAWIVVAFLAIGVVLNAVTPSGRERALWLPVCLVLLGCAVVVARAPDR